MRGSPSSHRGELLDPPGVDLVHALRQLLGEFAASSVF
jgi:hypothetical protein